MAGLTVVGDVQVLRESVELLKSDLGKYQVDLECKYKKILDSIEQRLLNLEEICFPQRILELPDNSWENIRAKRNYLLTSTDWTASSGCTVSPLAWAEYRQYLRDLPQTFDGASPEEVVWPKQPSAMGPHTVELYEGS